jgi:hypothetical protein
MQAIDVAFIIGGICAVFATILSAYSIYGTILYNSHAELRRHVVRYQSNLWPLDHLIVVFFRVQLWWIFVDSFQTLTQNSAARPNLLD